ncbi:MAG TPA: hypothetical protein VF510_18975 [Ktedonobacterales bacterium]|jgi:hypothetical protein
MRLKWPEWTARERVVSRPRVSRAIQAARQAKPDEQASLGSAVALSPITLPHLNAIDRAAVSGPLHKASRRARRGLSPDLVWATARAAQQLGRQPEEVWAEALHDWLTARQESTPTASLAQLPRPIETRRLQVWQNIDETLSALRAC